MELNIIIYLLADFAADAREYVAQYFPRADSRKTPALLERHLPAPQRSRQDFQSAYWPS
jgi:hypothetical protein